MQRIPAAGDVNIFTEDIESNTAEVHRGVK